MSGTTSKKDIILDVKGENMQGKRIPFNNWSKEKINLGRKFCTSRHKKYTDDDRVEYITEKLPWGLIKRLLWQTEGADNPEELQQVIDDIYRRHVKDDEKFFVHFGDFSDDKMAFIK